MWDTSEYISAAYTLGLPHPPGNPLFVLIGRVFSILPIAPNVAMRGANGCVAIGEEIVAAREHKRVPRVLIRYGQGVDQERGWLDPVALLRGDLTTVFAVVQRGLTSPEHAAFATRLRLPSPTA